MFEQSISRNVIRQLALQIFGSDSMTAFSISTSRDQSLRNSAFFTDILKSDALKFL